MFHVKTHVPIFSRRRNTMPSGRASYSLMNVLNPIFKPLSSQFFFFFNLNFKMWDTTSTGEGEQSLHGGDTKAMEIATLEFSHDGSKLAAVINNCDYVQVLETESGKLLTSIKVC